MPLMSANGGEKVKVNFGRALTINSSESIIKFYVLHHHIKVQLQNFTIYSFKISLNKQSIPVLFFICSKWLLKVILININKKKVVYKRTIQTTALFILGFREFSSIQSCELMSTQRRI